MNTINSQVDVSPPDLLVSTSENKHDLQIYSKQVDTLYRQIPGFVIGPTTGAVLLVFLMWGQLTESLLVGWLVAVLIAVGVAPAILLFVYRRDKNRARHSEFWGRWMFFISFSAGLSWGSAGYWLFTPGSMEYQLVLFLFMYAAAAVVMTAMVSTKPEFFAVVLSVLVPIAVRSAQVGDSFHMALSATTFVYLGTVIFFHHIAHNTMVDSFRLQFENMNLANKLTEKIAEVERANREKSRFLAAASHDLRQPVHAQALFVAELQSRIKDPECLSVLGYLENTLGAMRELFNTLLDISRLDAGMVTPEIEEFLMADVLSTLESEFLPQMTARSINFRILPCSYAVRSDPVLLERILRNFLSNAMCYTPKGSVLVCCRKRGKQLQVQVRDNGMGISEKQQAFVFEEFAQLNNPERDQEKGLGLGLSIVNRLSRLLQHPVKLVSQPGSGSIFSVDLPLSENVGVSLKCARSTTAVNRDLSGLSVLVIDDNVMVQKAMMRLLHQWGCKTQVASSTDEALAGLMDQGHPPDVIIADYRLREERTGSQAISLINQQLDKTIPAILVTGDTAPERLREAQASGHRLLHKPLEPDILHDVLNQLMFEKAP